MMTELMARTLNRLGQQLRGRLSLPGDESFTAATSIWAKPTGRMPRAVVHCRTPEDVQLAIWTARDCDVPVSVRGGGHDWAGRALCEGLVIDMSGMNHVAVDAKNGVARVSGGARASDVTAVTDPCGLAAVTGSVGAVGMTGLTLGGGYGPLIGRFGLALDNLLFAEVVMADGRILVTKHDQERELFWALRGGGGNFGVVTAMHHRVHDLPSVRSGMLVYPFSEAKAVLERSAEIAAAAPEALTMQLGLIAGPDGIPVVFIAPTWCGEPGEGEAQIAPLLNLGSLLASTVGTIRYGAALAAFDDYLVNGQRVFMETCWLPALASDSIEAFIDAMETAPSQGCAIFTHEFKGAASRVRPEATAFGFRRDHVLVEVLATFADRPGELEEARHRRWARDARLALDEMALPGGYANFLTESDAIRAASAYGGNAGRLAEAKRRFDPDNIFRSAIPLPRAEELVADPV